MQVEEVPINSVYQDPANARRHSDRNIESIVGSLRANGQMTPIVVDMEGKILKGNGTHTAMLRMGEETIWVVRTTLEGYKAAAYAIADNRTAELAEWDNDTLARTVRAIMESGQTVDEMAIGFNQEEIEALLEEFTVQPANQTTLANEQGAVTMTFTLTPLQREIVQKAIDGAKSRPGFGNTEGNKNGAALTIIAGEFNG